MSHSIMIGDNEGIFLLLNSINKAEEEIIVE